MSPFCTPWPVTPVTPQPRAPSKARPPRPNIRFGPRRPGREAQGGRAHSGRIGEPLKGQPQWRRLARSDNVEARCQGPVHSYLPPVPPCTIRGRLASGFLEATSHSPDVTCCHGHSWPPKPDAKSRGENRSPLRPPLGQLSRYLRRVETLRVRLKRSVVGRVGAVTLGGGVVTIAIAVAGRFTLRLRIGVGLVHAHPLCCLVVGPPIVARARAACQ